MYVEVQTLTDEGQTVVAQFEVSEGQHGEVQAVFCSAVVKSLVGLRDIDCTESFVKALGVYAELEQDALDRFDPGVEEEESEADAADLRAQGRRERE